MDTLIISTSFDLVKQIPIDLQVSVILLAIMVTGVIVASNNRRKEIREVRENE